MVRFTGPLPELPDRLVVVQTVHVTPTTRTDCEIGKKVGEESRLRFDKAGTIVNMRYRIDRIDAKAGILWTCIAHDMPPWIGTTLEWKIDADGSDAVRVSLTHAGWKEEPPPPVVQGWQHFLGSMKKYHETGTGEPW